MRKILTIDGKTMRGNRSKTQEPLHIVSAFSKADGVCLGQVPTDKKSNEITAIPPLLDHFLHLEGNVITIDTMGTQTKIVDKILEKKADYCLAVKENQKELYTDISEYMTTPSFQKDIKQTGHHVKTVEKARGNIETCDYYICPNVD